jgi:putative ABC transport system permease protein
MGTRSLLRLLPAVAMRPPAPRIVKSDLLKKIPALRAVLAAHGQMAVRNITRNRFRSVFIACAIAFSFSIMAYMSSYGDIMDTLVFDQFNYVLKYDVKATLSVPQSPTEAEEAAYALGNIQDAQALLEIPAQLRLGNLKEGAVIIGLREDSTLYRIYDNATGKTHAAPTGGAILGHNLAKKLHASRGDLLMVTTAYTGEREIAVPVLGVIEENLGASMYMERDSLCDFLGIPRMATGVLMKTQAVPEVREELVQADNVRAVSDTASEKRLYDDMMSNYAALIVIMQLSGVAIAYAIITVTASISMSERKREYATLRVLGMRPWEVSQITMFEYAVLTAGGILAGIPLTRAIKTALFNIVQTDSFSLPVTTPASSFLVAAAGCAAAVLLSNLSSVRVISRLDMVDVLKERE